jgi:pentalenolactone synthase
VVQVRTPAGDPAWLVSRYEHVRQLLADPDMVRSHADPNNAPRYAHDVFAAPVGDHATYKEDHARIRRVFTKLFTARRVQQVQPRIEAVVADLLSDLTSMSPPVDFREHFALRVPVNVISEILGIPEDGRAQLVLWSDDAQSTLDDGRAVPALINIHQYLMGVIEQRRKEPTDDVLSALVAAHGADELTDAELIRISHTLLFSGYTSAVARIEFGTMLLLTHDEQRAALQEDPDLAPRVVEEILRIAMPSFGGVPRWAAKDFEIGGQLIRSGDLVLVGTEVANHDPEAFPEPEKFDVFRAENPNAHLTFGHGSYFCGGAALARVELQAVFRSLFRQLPKLRLAVPAYELTLREQSLIGGFQELPVTW